MNSFLCVISPPHIAWTIREYKGGSRFQNHDTLFARITPCLENGKTGLVNYLTKEEIAFGSTEFIVIRPKKDISPFWIYCLAKDENFKYYAISSMINSSSRQRIHESYFLFYKIPKVDFSKMNEYHKNVTPTFETIKVKNALNEKLTQLLFLLLSRLANLERN